MSAPVFHNVMEGALRLMDVPPDHVEQWYAAKPVPPAATPAAPALPAPGPAPAMPVIAAPAEDDGVGL